MIKPFTIPLKSDPRVFPIALKTSELLFSSSVNPDIFDKPPSAATNNTIPPTAAAIAARLFAKPFIPIPDIACAAFAIDEITIDSDAIPVRISVQPAAPPIASSRESTNAEIILAAE